MASNPAKRRATPKKATIVPAVAANPAPRRLMREVGSILLYALSLFLVVCIGGYGIHTYSPEYFDMTLLGPVGEGTGKWIFGSFGVAGLLLGIWTVTQAVRVWHGTHQNRTSPRARGYIFLGLIGVLFSASVTGASFWGEAGGGRMGLGTVEFLSGRVGIGSPFVKGVSLLLVLFSIPLALERTVGDVLSAMGKGGKILSIFLGVQLPILLLGVGRFVLGIFWLGTRRLYRMALDPFSHVDRPLPVREIPLPKPKVRKNRVLIDEDVEEEEFEEEELAPVLVSRRLPKNTPKASQLQNPPPRRRSSDELPDDYQIPPVDLLKPGEVTESGEDDEELVTLSRQIENKLKDFGILGKVTEVHPGPVVTLFEFEPAAGVKVGKITALQDDLAMSIRATAIRIIAPLPKKGTVGIEVPNRHRDIVRLRDILESDAYINAESILSIAVGKDTYGDAVVVDIASMPHLLIAGATGTGKSVCINTLLLSLLYRSTPSELGLILIDPKILELSIYEGIPHLRVPVVTVPKQAKAVLDWAAKEMDRRYRMMQRYNVRNIDSYNQIIKGEQPSPLNQQIEVLTDVEEPGPGTSAAAERDPNKLVIAEQLHPLPKIVIVIDELADLMLTVGKDIEELITRLAQKARAAGIHLILATQRPSVDVITGLIKANFPARLSFRVTSRIDSRTILDSMGAERLLGKGDMLFMLPGAHALRRVHGAFVSDEEVQRVIGAIKKKSPPRYDERIMDICEKALIEEEQEASGESGKGVGADYDEFYDKAVELVVQKGQASTSMIQRTFRIGYNRAARIIEMMEKDGVVGPMDGIRPREVLVQNHDEV